MTIKCFTVEPVPMTKRWLRVYADGYPTYQCVNGRHYHDNKVELDIVDGVYDVLARLDWDEKDPRWPTSCAACGAFFSAATSTKQLFTRQLWRRTDTNEILPLTDMPDGAMYYATWMEDCKEYIGPDGRSLHVRVPHRHDWAVDARASNCDSPCMHCKVPYHAHKNMDHSYSDSVPDHKCWVRHGTPPNVTVNKAGKTCNAGGGSILTSEWHGFLIDGELRG